MADGNTLDKRSYNKRFREENAVIPRTTRWRLMKRLKESTENANIMQERNSQLTEPVDLNMSGASSGNGTQEVVHESIDATVSDESINENQDGNAGSLYDTLQDAENQEDHQDNFQNEGQQPIYEGAPISLDQSMLLILTFTFRHSLTGQCLSDLLTLISLHCMSPNICKTSLYLFRKYFSNINFPLVFHKYCSVCFYNVKTVDLKCPVCNRDLNDLKAVSYFVEIPLADQIQKLFKRQNFHKELYHRFERKKKSADGIEDIYDGEIYVEQSKKHGFLSNPNNISLMWYTDGVALFKSSKYGIWPLFFSINELPYKSRTKAENLLFGGLWFGEVKPSMGTFLKPFFKTLQTLNQDGVNVECNHCNIQINVKATLLCGTCDLPAKSIVLNMTQFNGMYGCPRCKQEGKVVKAGKGHTRVFTFNKIDPCGPLRLHDETKLHAAEAVRENKAVFGIKGPSWFSYLQLDIIRGTAIDYMHTVLLGVVRRLLTLWFSSTFSSEKFSISKNVDLVDKRLLTIKPPNFVTRIPRSIKDHSAYWKANECRSWLLFYSVPVLYGVLDIEYYKHYILLAEAIYLLSSDSLTKAMLRKANSLLTYFVCLHEALYGERHMSANIHQLIHLPEVVKDLGPLWVYGCFPFENMNGQLVKLFHGTRHPEIQISSAVSTLLHLTELGQKLDKETPVGLFYSNLSRTGSTKVIKYIGDKIGIVGRCIPRVLPNAQLLAVTESFGSQPKEILCFFRLLKDGKVFQSLQYTAVEERNSYTVMFCEVDGVKKFGHIDRYVEIIPTCSRMCHPQCICKPVHYAVVKELETNPDIVLRNGVSDESPINIYPVKPKYVNYRAVPIINVLDLCVYIQLNDCRETAFVAVSPNSLECD